MRFLQIAAALVLAACASPRGNMVASAGVPPEYQAGRAAGCDSGFVAAGHPYYRFSKDVAAYGADPTYKQGWDDGFAVCKGQYDAIGQAARR